MAQSLVEGYFLGDTPRSALTVPGPAAYRQRIPTVYFAAGVGWPVIRAVRLRASTRPGGGSM
jgi:hypothetical protein